MWPDLVSNESVALSTALRGPASLELSCSDDSEGVTTYLFVEKLREIIFKTTSYMELYNNYSITNKLHYKKLLTLTIFKDYAVFFCSRNAINSRKNCCNNNHAWLD